MQHLEDPYVKEFTATVDAVQDGKFVMLSQTYFYPSSGGQPHDEGLLRRKADGAQFRVVFAKKFDEVSHQVEPEGALQPGDEVEAVIDWERRYHLMRSHTAAHVVSALIRKKTGALITGNQLSLEKVRIDFSLAEYDPELFKGIINEANELIERGAPMRFEFVSQAEALKEPSLQGLAKGLPENERIRVVEITGLDRQACGGTHVRDIGEIGSLQFLKAENKGKQNRRVYFRLA